jgi:hypothetical protein
VWVCRLLSLRLVVRGRVLRLLMLVLERGLVALGCEGGARMVVLVVVRINLRPRKFLAGQLGLGCLGEAMRMFRSALVGLYFGDLADCAGQLVSNLGRKLIERDRQICSLAFGQRYCVGIVE